jgi:hypothetical protein
VCYSAAMVLFVLGMFPAAGRWSVHLIAAGLAVFALVAAWDAADAI